MKGLIKILRDSATAYTFNKYGKLIAYILIGSTFTAVNVTDHTITQLADLINVDL